MIAQIIVIVRRIVVLNFIPQMLVRLETIVLLIVVRKMIVTKKRKVSKFKCPTQRSFRVRNYIN